jgi:hypothetical protein
MKKIFWGIKILFAIIGAYLMNEFLLRLSDSNQYQIYMIPVYLLIIFSTYSLFSLIYIIKEDFKDKSNHIISFKSNNKNFNKVEILFFLIKIIFAFIGIITMNDFVKEFLEFKNGIEWFTILILILFPLYSLFSLAYVLKEENKNKIN